MTFDNPAPDPPAPDERFALPAEDQQLTRAADGLACRGFAVEILDDAGAARARVRELLQEGSTVYTSASETLRLSGIGDDINASGRYRAIGPLVMGMDRGTRMDEIRSLTATPQVVVGSVAAVTETGAVLAASASGSQIPAYGGGAAQRIWVVGAQKVVPDLDTALRRIETYCYPLEDARARAAYGQPSAVNEVLIVNGEPNTGRTRVLLLRQAIGY
ncbi:MAG: LUD domain-containing protein [Candidatus Dormibacteraceae bacterium]